MLIETHTVGDRTLRLFPRSSWHPVGRLGPAMRLPALGVTIHHSVTIATDDHELLATDDVAADMRAIESVGIARFGRFSYCYAVHPSGIVGVGAGLTIGAHTHGHNSTRIGVVLIGDMTRTRPTPAALDATATLIAWHQTAGRLVSGYNVNGHRIYKATACPGISDAAVRQLATTAHQIATTPTPDPEDDPMTAEQLADLTATIERTKPFAVRYNAAAEGRPAGQFWIIDPGGRRYPVGRPTLNALYFVGAIRADADNAPPSVNPTDFADIPTA